MGPIVPANRYPLLSRIDSYHVELGFMLTLCIAEHRGHGSQNEWRSWKLRGPVNRHLTARKTPFRAVLACLA